MDRNVKESTFFQAYFYLENPRKQAETGSRLAKNDKGNQGNIHIENSSRGKELWEKSACYT